MPKLPENFQANVDILTSWSLDFNISQADTIGTRRGFRYWCWLLTRMVLISCPVRGARVGWQLTGVSQLKLNIGNEKKKRKEIYSITYFVSLLNFFLFYCDH